MDRLMKKMNEGVSAEEFNDVVGILTKQMRKGRRTV